MKKEEALKSCLLAIIAIPVIFLSWIYYAFKTYGWYKPYTGEYFSNILPDLTFWNMFAISVVFTALLGNMNIKLKLSEIKSNTKDKEQDIGQKIIQAILMPWIALLFSWILYCIIF